MKKVLVTGADGFIGSHLVELLLREGFYVKAFCLLPMLPLSLNTRPLLVDDNSIIRIKMLSKKSKLSLDSHTHKKIN